MLGWGGGVLSTAVLEPSPANFLLGLTNENTAEQMELERHSCPGHRCSGWAPWASVFLRAKELEVKSKEDKENNDNSQGEPMARLLPKT